ncbi:hypothetical protein DXG01_006698 [Tephrocybe rancida]|nr:hypothetical protein DXG01_006698 [Tephrocybe rancida]
MRLTSALNSSGKGSIAANPDSLEKLKCSDQSPTTPSYTKGPSPTTELSSPNVASDAGAECEVDSPAPHPAGHGRTRTRPISSPEYKALAGQFASSVVVSTFTAALIIAFLGLAWAIFTQPATPDPVALLHFDIGMFLGMSAVGLHIGIIVVGGRATALCFRLAARLPDDIDVEANTRTRELAAVDFYRYVRYCEHLQLLASITLLGFFLFLAYTMFTHKTFFWLLLASSAIGGFSVFNTGFWKVSVSWEAFTDAWRWFEQHFLRRT